MTVILQIRDLQHPQSDSLLSLAERQASDYFSTAPDSSEYKSSDEFHIASRLLEFRAQLSSSKPDSTNSTPPKFPSLSTSDSSRTPQERLLDHFASEEGEKWCERNLGFELWRREVELRFGSNEGGEWRRSWDRLKLQLEKGWGLFQVPAWSKNWCRRIAVIRIGILCFISFVAPSLSPPTLPHPIMMESSRRYLLRQKGWNCSNKLEKSSGNLRRIRQKQRLNEGFLWDCWRSAGSVAYVDGTKVSWSSDVSQSQSWSVAFLLSQWNLFKISS